MAGEMSEISFRPSKKDTPRRISLANISRVIPFCFERFIIRALVRHGAPKRNVRYHFGGVEKWVTIFKTYVDPFPLVE